MLKMNGGNYGKSSPNSSKMSFSKVYIVSEGKQKKSKRKKKNKKCSISDSWKSDVEGMKHASSDDKRILGNIEIKGLGGNCK